MGHTIQGVLKHNMLNCSLMGHSIQGVLKHNMLRLFTYGTLYTECIKTYHAETVHLWDTLYRGVLKRNMLRLFTYGTLYTGVY
jgi:hypothetical protein